MWLWDQISTKRTIRPYEQMMGGRGTMMMMKKQQEGVFERGLHRFQC